MSAPANQQSQFNNQQLQVHGSTRSLKLPRGCFTSVLDLAIARNIRLGGARNVQVRVDMFNAPNSAIITNRNTTMNLSNPNDPVTATNLPYTADGSVNPSRSLPRNAGFAVANGYQTPRTIQLQLRFSF